MRVLGYTWAGVRTSDLKSSARFFSDVLGLSRTHEGRGFVQFEMPSGQLFEIFDSESRYYQFHACPVLAFQVEDVHAARKELASQAIDFVLMSRATTRRLGFIFADLTVTYTSFGKPRGL